MTIFNIIALGYLLYSYSSILQYITDVALGSLKWYSFIDCTKCTSFWLTLLITRGDITAAALVSLVVLLLESFIVTKL